MCSTNDENNVKISCNNNLKKMQHIKFIFDLKVSMPAAR